jgi:hypothetical protein
MNVALVLLAEQEAQVGPEAGADAADVRIVALREIKASVECRASHPGWISK